MRERIYGHEEVGPINVRFVQSETSLADYLTDEANSPGGSSELMVEFLPSDTEILTRSVSELLSKCSDGGQPVVVQGGRSSLTGAAVPKGDVIFNLSRLQGMEIFSIGENTYARVQPGVTIENLDTELKNQGLFFPPAPTYPSATVIGAVSTNAAGARSYKYDSVRDYVEGIQVVLASGDEMYIERGKYMALPGDEESPNGYFLLETNDGVKRINVPTYEIPDVPKVSAGYYAGPNMDLIDLFIGSEGTLGVITEATVRVMEEPPTFMALVQCVSDGQAVALINMLRNFEPDKLESKLPGGISAVEYIGSSALDLIRGKKLPKQLENSEALLLVQIEGIESMESFFALCEAAGINTDDDTILAAEPDDSARKDEFINIREAVPHAVNDLIRARGLTKAGSDPCVRPEDLGKMMAIYNEEFTKAGIEFCWWGHGEGNLHYNALPKTSREVELAMEAIRAAGERVIKELHGTGTAEHGIGKNIPKQQMLEILYGMNGIAQMLAIKYALDPNFILGRGNIFPYPGNNL